MTAVGFARGLNCLSMAPRHSKRIGRLAPFLAFLALAAGTLLASCGGESTKGKELNQSQANSLLAHLEQLSALSLPDRCSEAQAQATALLARVNALSADIREDLRSALTDGSENLDSLIRAKCAGKTTTTPTTTTRTETTPTETQTTQTTETQTTETQTTPETQTQQPQNPPGGGGEQQDTSPGGSGGVGAGSLKRGQ